MTPSEELNSLISKKDRLIAEKVSNFYSDLVKASPVDTGTFRASWDLQKSNYKWTISNNAEYASILFGGRRLAGNKMIGSEQWQEGGEPMLQRFENDLQRNLDNMI